MKMIIGNQEAKNQLNIYLTKHATTQLDQSSFFLLHGPNNIGKSSIALEVIQNYLGNYMQSGLLYIKDYSEILGKRHSIKIEENTTTEEYKTLFNEHQYRDVGVREINGWLQQSSFGGSKVLLIENIERMTREATNAFLKACEEPLSKRVIVATTSNKAKILDTILSRAISIPCMPLNPKEMEEYIKYKNIVIESDSLKEILIMMAMGRPGTLDSFYQLVTKNEKLKVDTERLIRLLPNPGHIFEKYMILNAYKEQGIVESFLDGRIAYCANHHTQQAAKRLKVKKMLQSNVQVENVLLYGLLS